jgi:predicted lipoprotein with Yx(FWY)xxD motif
MKRLLTLIGAASLVLAACGDDDDNASDTVPSAGNAATTSMAGSAAGSATVTVVKIEGLGDVLADADGMALYFNDQDTDSSVLCDNACTDEWPPLEATSDTPTGDGVSGLATADRPDGTKQVTYQGHPLYTFVDDESAGQASGDGDADEFDGQQFSWHAATVDMAGSSGGAATTPAGSQPSDTTASTGTGY